MKTFHPQSFFDLKSYAHKSLFESIDYVWEALGRIEKYLAQYSYTELETSRYPGVTFVNPEQISLGEGVIIEPGAYIRGPCILGKGTIVRQGAYVRGQVITGDKCVIGHCTELKSVILLNGVHIAHLAYGGDSIYGNHCNLGAGCKNANLKFFEDSPITIQNGLECIALSLRKLGAILGDGVQLGCNSVTNPGTLIGKNSCLFPCTNFGGVAPDDSLIHLEKKAVVTPRKVKVP